MSEGTAPALTLRLFGSPSLLAADGKPVLGLGKPLALVAYVACAPARTATRDQLVDLLWSDVDREAARHTLRQTLWYIKRRAGTELFATRGDVVTLHPALLSDRDRFLEALDSGRLDDAVERYVGEFFAGFAAPGGAEFEQWSDVERTRLRSLFVHAAEGRVRELLGTGASREAATEARRVRDLAPTAQATWRLLLETLLSADDRIGALVEAEQLEQWLARDELPMDKATAASLRLVRSEQARVEPAAAEGLQAELVGREREFAALMTAWDDARRGLPMHLHLHARAGLGKSRLLYGVARRLRAQRHRVVTVRALQANRDIPSALAAELVLALAKLRGAAGVSPEAAAALVALAPAVSTYLSQPPDRATGDDALRRRTLALQELVTTIAEDAPLALLVDDLHWADAPSRAMLTSLAASLDEQRVLLVTAGRTAERATRDDGRFRQLGMAGLDADDVAALLASLGELPSAPWTDALPVRLAEVTDGSPLLILETLQLALERGALQLHERAWHLRDASALETLLAGDSAIGQRVRAVTEPQQAMLLLLAVLGSDIGPLDAQRVGGDAGVNALIELEARGLLAHVDGRWAVAHDEIAALALEQAPAARIARGHREAATLLEALPAESTVQVLRAAHHRHAAGDATEAARLLADAARRTNAAGDAQALASLARSVVGRDAPAGDVEALVRALPWRLRVDAKRAGLTAVTPVLLAFALAWGATRGPTAPLTRAPEAVASVPVLVDNTLHLLRIPLDAATVQRAEVIEAVEEPLPAATSRRLLDYTHWYARRGDTLVLGSLRTEEGNGAELELVTLPTGEVRRLASAREDDNTPSFAPDGRRAVISTGRWDTLTSRNDLGVLDLQTQEVTPLVQSPEVEWLGLWSPDGSRIAFYRTHYTSGKPSELCWVTVDATVEECLPQTPELDAPMPRAWYDVDELIVEGEAIDGGGRMLAHLHLGTGALRILHRSGGAYAVSPDGRFAIVSMLGEDGATTGSAVFATDRPQHLVPVRWRGREVAAAPVQVAWTVGSPRAIASITIEAPREPVPLDAITRLTARAADALGVVRAVGVLHWRSLDPDVADVSREGELLPRRPGTARIVANAGGWRSDTARVGITERRFATPVLRETWAVLDTSVWVDFGRPIPEVRGGALLPNDDGRLASGVISWATIDPSDGIGVEYRAAVPVNAPAWQSAGVYLNPVAPTEALRLWPGRREGRENVAYRALVTPRICGVRFPRGEGGGYMRQALLTTGNSILPLKSLDTTLTDGSWHTYRLQLFRDGRFGLAIDGRVVAVSETRIPLDAPLRVYIDGQSVGTTVRVGALEVWRGERLDLPWFARDSVQG